MHITAPGQQRRSARPVPLSNRRARIRNPRTARQALALANARIAAGQLEEPAIVPGERARLAHAPQHGPQLIKGGRPLSAFPSGPRHGRDIHGRSHVGLLQIKDLDPNVCKGCKLGHAANLTVSVSLSNPQSSSNDILIGDVSPHNLVMSDILLFPGAGGVLDRQTTMAESLGMRLKRLRKARNWKQREVAERLSVTEVSVTRWETDDQVPRGPDIKRLADLYSVPQAWLHYGGSGGPQTVSIVGIVSAGQTIIAADDGPLGEVMVPFGTPADMLAVEVRGDSMLPQYEDGDRLLYRGIPQNADELIGRRCVVRTEAGQVLVKTLRRGALIGTYDLDSSNAATIPNQRLVWVAKVEAVIHK